MVNLLSFTIKLLKTSKIVVLFINGANLKVSINQYSKYNVVVNQGSAPSTYPSKVQSVNQVNILGTGGQPGHLMHTEDSRKGFMDNSALDHSHNHSYVSYT